MPLIFFTSCRTGLPAYVVEGLVGAFAAVRDGRFAYTTDCVKQITGRSPRTFKQWRQAIQAAFRQ